MAIPSKAIVAPTIPYIVAVTSLRWNRRRRSEAEVGDGGRWRSLVEVGGGGRWRSVTEFGGCRRRRLRRRRSRRRRRRLELEVEAEFDVRVRISCGVVVEVVVVQASVFARGVSIPVFIRLFQFIFFQCLNSRLSGHHMLCFFRFD